MSAISQWSALERLSRPTSSKPVLARPLSTISPMRASAALAHRAGDHAGLAEAAAAGAAAEDLDAHPLVHALGERDERRLGIRPLVEVHHRVLRDAPRHARAVRRDALDATVGQVVDVVERRHVDTAGARETEQQLLAAAGPALGLPGAHDLGDREHGLLAVAQHRGVDEVGDRLGVEGRVAAGDDDRVRLVAVARVQRDAREVERGQHVGVAELGGEAQAEQVERADRAVRSTVNCGTPCARMSASRSGHTEYVRSASTSGCSLRTS